MTMSMEQTPEDLRSLIRRIAREEAKREGKVIRESALDGLARIPQGYADIEVDVNRLRKMLADVISIAPKDIDADGIRQALKDVECHYLWFC
jgi:hypothetical protein